MHSGVGSTPVITHPSTTWTDENSGIDIYSTCATLREYHAMPRTRRIYYQFLRHPAVTQILLPPLVFLLLYRVPFDSHSKQKHERRSVLATNMALAVTLGALSIFLGFWTMVLVQFPIMVVASIIGVWLFSVQHRFEESLWERQERWSHVHASLEGSSYLKLPRILQWFTGNIGFHHVHHLSSRVPNYRLQECHEASPELQARTTLTFWEALGAPCYALWDEDLRRMTRVPPTRKLVAPLASTISSTR